MRRRRRVGRVISGIDRSESPSTERFRQEDIEKDPSCSDRSRSTFDSPVKDTSLRRSERLKTTKSNPELFEKLKEKRRHRRWGGGAPDGSGPVDLTRTSSDSAGSEAGIREAINCVIGGGYSDSISGPDRDTSRKKKADKRVPRSTLNTSRSIASMEELRKTTLVTDLQLESELKLEREDWLEWSGPKLGSRGLDYLHELNKQWKLSSNIYGKVKGKMKNFIAVAGSIIETMVEKLEASGDVLLLKTQNIELNRRVGELERMVKRNQTETEELHRRLGEAKRELD